MKNLRRLRVEMGCDTASDETVLDDVWKDILTRLDTAYVYRGDKHEDLKARVLVNG